MNIQLLLVRDPGEKSCQTAGLWIPRWTRRVCSFLVLLLFAGLVSYSFRQGWNRAGTDFPNYYTAAVLLRKGEKLRNYYDWRWFQRQMNYAGIERQLGGYIPQTPLTMLPLTPMSGFSPQAAKRIWLVLNLIFLVGTVWLLSRITRFSVPTVVLFALAGYGSLHVNLVLGQYYIFLLLLLTLAFYCVNRGRSGTGGLLLGLAFALKLYGGPFVLYFAAKRRWKIVAGFLLGSVFFGAVAVAIFGWADVAYFATHILPRALKGETLDPYNPGNGTISTLLRRTFLHESELNPHPLLPAPWLFFFLQPLLAMAILVIPILMVSRWTSPKTGFAVFMIATILASPNTASYTFILLLLPVTLLMEQAQCWKQIALLLLYAVLAFPMRPSWNWLFPKVWGLTALFVLATLGCWRWFPWKPVLVAAILMTLAATWIARRSLTNYHQEPGYRCKQIAVQEGAIYSSSPAVLRSGIVYESIGSDRYVLRWQHGIHNEQFVFQGEAFRPFALSPEGPIQFELVTRGASSTCWFTPPAAADLHCAPRASPVEGPVASGDGKWTAVVRDSWGTKQIWLRRNGAKSLIRFTGGDCNNFAPAWELDSKAILFASDCGRGVGLPALYRAPVPVAPVH